MKRSALLLLVVVLYQGCAGSRSAGQTEGWIPLFDIEDVREAPATDNEWFTVRIVVEDRHVRTFVDDRLVVEYTEPEGAQPPSNHPERMISSGTFAFQGHDPESEVHYRNVMVRPLPD